MTDWRALCEELADALDHNRQCLLDDCRLTHPLADKARAALAEPDGPTLQLPEQAPDERPPSNLDRREVAAWYHGHGCGWQAARAALAAEPTITRQPEFSGQVVWEQGNTLGIAPDEQTARTDAARAVEPVAAQRTDVSPLQVALARVERLADDFSSACRPLVELAEKLAAGPVAEKAPVVPISVLLHPAYEPGDGSADGAQMVEMAWWHPVMGCDSLQIVVDNARAALAQPVGEQPAPPAEGEGLTDKELFRIASDCQALYIADDVDYDNCSEVVAAMRAAIAADRARYSHQPSPAAEGKLADHELGCTFDADYFIENAAARNLNRAADLLEQRHPTPVPVSERLPRPEDCDAEGRCWWWRTDDADEWWELLCISDARENNAGCGNARYTHWLPATALPLPQGEVQP